MGRSSVENASAEFSSLQIWGIPYLYPTRSDKTTGYHAEAAVANTYFHPKIWENYWIPFGKKTGVIPALPSGPPHMRSVFMSSNAEPATDNDHFKTPADIKNMKIRRTRNPTTARTINSWGADPIFLGWGDMHQGLRTGVIDGFQTWSESVYSFGMAESMQGGEIILNDFGQGWGMYWTSVDWLKGLSDSHQSIIADASREAFEKLVRLIPKGQRRLGQTPDSPLDNAAESFDITVNTLNQDEVSKWFDPVHPRENQDMWVDIIRSAESLNDGMFDIIWNVAQSDISNPKKYLENYEVEMWWDNIIDRI